jgi:quercetin dioxygenase-like cupin family protein
MIERKQIEADWTSRGYSCGLWTDPAGQRWEDFVHDVDEVVMVIEGTMELEIDGEVHRPTVYEELFIPAGAPHSCAISATTPPDGFTAIAAHRL